jgi:hypothetical protein
VIQAVNNHVVESAPAADPPPILDHSRLQKCEGEKGSDCKERNQMICDATEDNQQERRQERQRINPLRIDQSPPARGEDARQKAMLRYDPAEAREVGEACVRRERKRRENRSDTQVVKEALSSYSARCA